MPFCYRKNQQNEREYNMSKTTEMPKGLKLFVADIIDEDTDKQTLWFIVGQSYESALNRFIRTANKIWYRYAYHFYEVEKNDTINEFVKRQNIIKAAIYDKESYKLLYK